MEFDWTVARIDFMEKFSAKASEYGNIEAALEHYETRLSCSNCAFIDVCSLKQNLPCYDTLKAIYKEYRKKFEKETTTTEKTKEKMLVFIELDGGIEETLRVTADQYKVIKHLAERNYFDEAVRFLTEETLEYNLTDFT